MRCRPKVHGRPVDQNHTVPYGTEPVCDVHQALRTWLLSGSPSGTENHFHSRLFVSLRGYFLRLFAAIFSSPSSLGVEAVRQIAYFRGNTSSVRFGLMGETALC
jgi:hypothetical protein